MAWRRALDVLENRVPCRRIAVTVVTVQNSLYLIPTDENDAGLLERQARALEFAALK